MRFNRTLLLAVCSFALVAQGQVENTNKAPVQADTITNQPAADEHLAEADKAWKEFGADAEWQQVAKESEANGRLVTKVERRFMTATDYSPEIKPAKSGEARVFELRTYTATPDHLENLNARFREHTCKLFEKHGMANVAYWNLMPNEKDADNTLIYILAHKSKEASGASWKAFREDPVWVAAKKASEEKAGGSLTVPDGVKSVFMAPTDYSPTK